MGSAGYARLILVIAHYSIDIPFKMNMNQRTEQHTSTWAHVLVLFFGITMVACGSGADVHTAHNSLTDEERDEGWILLFDGETTDGWRGYNQSEFPANGWVVEDGTLRCIGSETGDYVGEGGDILYDQQFQDFRISLEWKLSEAGNSGIFYLGQELEGEPIWKSAPEMQILDNENHPDATHGQDGNRKAGSLYDLLPADPQNTKPVGEWNHAEVMVNNGTITHFQNGEPVVEYEMGTSTWERMVEASKFAEFPEFGKYQPGYIALQDHGDDVWFRNIKLLPM